MGGSVTHIVVAGNVTEDRAPDGGWVPGGPSLYAARMAHALGARVTLLTTLSPSFDRACLEGLEVPPFPADVLPRYANAYDAGEIARSSSSISESRSTWVIFTSKRCRMW